MKQVEHLWSLIDGNEIEICCFTHPVRGGTEEPYLKGVELRFAFD